MTAGEADLVVADFLPLVDLPLVDLPLVDFPALPLAEAFGDTETIGAG